MATNRATAPSSAPSTAPSSAPNLSYSAIRVLSLPWLDRTIAAVACVPLVYVAYYRYVHWHHGFPLIAAAVNTLILVVTMVVRRPPKRVTPNPLYWLLAFVATYWLVFVLFFLQKGRPLAANWISDLLAVAGISIVIWARLSLGRNIGFVPAQRDLVHTGAYAFMRHPVYTGMLLTNIAFVLRAFSPLNALLMGLGAFWFIPVKSLVEEDFLRHDPQYAAYMQKVRARWIPFVI
jgi:protein-S-isoprenylcysteine O-methyltransferase Ste14